MIALHIRFEVSAVEMASADIRRPEWPPSPYRVQSALLRVALHRLPELRPLLDRMVAQPPAIACDLRHTTRGDLETGFPTFFVPVLYRSDPRDYFMVVDGKYYLAPPLRQPRYFPSASPANPEVVYVWQDLVPSQHEVEILDQACKLIGYIGTPQGIVSAWASYDISEPLPGVLYLPYPPNDSVSEHTSVSYRPAFFTRVMRSVDEALAQYDFNAKLRSSQRIDRATRSLPYYPALKEEIPTIPESPIVPSPMYPLILVLSPKTREIRPRLRHTNAITLDVHRWLRKHAFNAIGYLPEWISGHAPGSNEPSRDKRGHVAVFPIPSDIRQDTFIRSIGIAIPAHAPAGQLQRLIHELGGSMEVGKTFPLSQPFVFSTSDWRWELSRAQLLDQMEWIFEEAPEKAANGLGKSRVWVSVTPVFLDRYPKSNDAESIAEMLKLSFTNAGYPAPSHIHVTNAAPYRTLPTTQEFTSIQTSSKRKNGFVIHARVLFEYPIIGPVLVGQGRFFGIGTFVEDTVDA